MKFSEYFLQTLIDTPAEAEIVSHKLMLKAGMIKQSSSGIYSWLPLGFKVLKNIEYIDKVLLIKSSINSFILILNHLQNTKYDF